MLNNNSHILVSICCITYNHAPFIRKALEGFLMQQPPTCVPKGAKLSDWCEILIHDDCSTDGTDDIIREYAEKYPNVIFPLYEEENQFSRGGAGKMDLYNYNRVRGKYVAYCEGDDYWTDEHKLQKQVDWMEAHPDYSVCFHRVKHHYVNTDKYKDDRCGQLLGHNDGVDITPDIFFRAWYVQPLSMLFRTSMYDFSLPVQYKYYRDSHEIYHLLKNGKGYIFSFVGGIYNRHKGGIASMIGQEQIFSDSFLIANELYEHNKDKYTRDYLASTLQWILDYDRFISKRKRMGYILHIFWLNGNVLKFMKNLRNLIMR